MATETTPQPLQSSPVPAPGSPALDLDEIQGDVLIGLQKNFERFIFFEIKNVPAFKYALRHQIAPRITTTRTVHQRELLLQELKKRGDHTLLHLLGLNVSFTNSGITKLVPGADLVDTSFKAGAKQQAASLNDTHDSADPLKLTNWLPAFLSDTIDGVFFITAETENAVNDEAHHLLNLIGSAISVVADEMGQARPGLERGHEHFGWLDGVSQPGVKGLTDAFPGQRLLDAGLFVFGYPQPPAPTRPAQPPPPDWVKNGSFMVFRRLNQLVPEFTNYILDQAEHIQVTDAGGNLVSTQMDPVLLGARMVGRWKSGAPLALTPSQDDTTLGADPNQNNNFDYSDDRDQRRCPYGAHIRKTNPRADFDPTQPESSQEQDVDPRRIIRAGIPFGNEVSATEQTQGKTLEERGLMFVCYQTSIPFQFEFLQISWVNNKGFIFNKSRPSDPTAHVTVGQDPIIGQNALNGQPQPRQTDEPFSNYPAGNVRSTLNEPSDFVVPTGGGYFFTPSISALKQELSA
jgi:Dyp-type peroxidase family